MTHTVCPWRARDDVFEGYVRETLGPDDRQAFEAHYFECDECARRIEAYQDLHRGLGAAQVAAHVAARPAGRVRPWWWVALPAAASVLIVVGAAALWLSGPARMAPESRASTAQSPAPSGAPSAPPATTSAPPAPAAAPSPSAVPLSVLARVEPPSYLPTSQPRATPSEAAERFDAAMRRYMDADYAGAIPGLRAAADLRPEAPQYAFFLGACLLLTGGTEPAVTELERAIALGESPFLEEAHFYLAKARLRQGQPGAAREQLTRTIERHGRFEKEARQLLAQVNVLVERQGR
jgi:TolA-binding protein